jgi:hypothetical protein
MTLPPKPILTVIRRQLKMHVDAEDWYESRVDGQSFWVGYGQIGDTDLAVTVAEVTGGFVVEVLQSVAVCKLSTNGSFIDPKSLVE